MRLYFVFATWDYEAEGGAYDCVGIRSTPEAAQALGDAQIEPYGSKDSAHIAIVHEDMLKIIAVCRYPGLWTGRDPNLDQTPASPDA